MNGAVTVTDINGNVLATGTTGANGAYSLGGAISNPPIIVTIASTPTSTFSNGYAFKGELKGLFTTGDATNSLQVTIPSTILYKIWDEMGRPTDITAARASAESFLQLLGMDTSAVTSLWSTNPVGLNYEILQQQLVFLCGQDDASGASDIYTRAAALASAYVTAGTPLDADTAGTVAALINTYTGYKIDTDGSGSATNFAAFFALAAVKNAIATAVKTGLTGTSAASQVSSTDTILSQLTTQNTAAAAFSSNPAAITLATGTTNTSSISNSNITQVVPYSGTATYGVKISGIQVDGTAATGSPFTISAMTTGLSATVGGSAVVVGTTTFASGSEVTFTVPTTTPGTYSVTVKYTVGTASLSTTFYFKVLASGVVWATGGGFSTGPESLVFTDTSTTKITAGASTTTGGTGTIGKFTPTATTSTNFITSFYLPDGMYFVDSANKFWPNWDVTATAASTSQQAVTLPSGKTIKANKDLSYGEFTWTFRVFDENRDQLLTSGTGTSIVYGSGGANAVRRITEDKYSSDTARTYATSGAEETITSGDNGSITLTSNFTANVQTWAMAGGTSTDTLTTRLGDFYLNVKSSNFDSYAAVSRTYGFTSSGLQNHDVTATLGTWDSTNKCYPITIAGGSTAFYPDYGAGKANLDKIRIGIESTSGTKSAGDVMSNGVTFVKN